MVRAPNWVGDAVMAVPALRELRRIFSGARITLVARPWVAELFEGEDLADQLIPVDDQPGALRRVRGFVRDARRLRRERFDLAVLLPNAIGAALLARAAGAGVIAGYPTDGRKVLLDVAVPFPPDYRNAHHVRRYLDIAAHVEHICAGRGSVERVTSYPTLRVSVEQKERAIDALASAGVDFERKGAEADAGILALNPGATNSRAKRWLPERFAETADRLARAEGFQTIIVGAPGDVTAALETASRMRSPSHVLAGKTTIGQLKSMLSLTSLVISNDTGTAHLSAALGVPTVVVFGPTEHRATRPLADLAVVVRHDVECSPCLLKDCPIDHRCMTRVEVDDVYRAATSLIEGRGLSRAT